ncbi:MAG: hypothetical protein CMM01_26365 [Rhodopirellula sp.]|nr:hypothetical protein [Rhodopirellula sp.]
MLAAFKAAYEQDKETGKPDKSPKYSLKGSARECGSNTSKSRYIRLSFTSMPPDRSGSHCTMPLLILLG